MREIILNSSFTVCCFFSRKHYNQINHGKCSCKIESGQIIKNTLLDIILLFLKYVLVKFSWYFHKFTYRLCLWIHRGESVKGKKKLEFLRIISEVIRPNTKTLKLKKYSRNYCYLYPNINPWNSITVQMWTYRLPEE